jgi:hypothetical protein
LKTNPDQLRIANVPLVKCDWRGAPSIQRYLLSLKPDLSAANSPGVWPGNAPQTFSVIGPNCRVPDLRYSHPQKTK